MPKASFFERLGFFAVDRFLDTSLCAQLRSAFHAGTREAATVGPELVVDRKRRSVDWVSVDETLRSIVRNRLLEAKPAIAAHYDVPLSDCQKPQFLVYGIGDYYQAHRDCGSSAVSKARRVSAVIFLNSTSETEQPSHYGGGALTFYGLVDDPSGSMPGIPLEADEGLLMTFPSETLHSVRPVTHGERYTIASWYV